MKERRCREEHLGLCDKDLGIPRFDRYAVVTGSGGGVLLLYIAAQGAVKNAATQTYRNVQALAGLKIALTGTPLQNRLNEFSTLLRLLVPEDEVLEPSPGKVLGRPALDPPLHSEPCGLR